MFFDDAYFDLDPDVYYAQEDNLCGFAPGILLAEDVWDKHASVFQGAETPQTSTGTFSETAAGSTLGQETESCPELQLHEALLTRHFVEVISPWLDVFDTDRYFGHTVPVNSLRSRLLRDTILAIAARQIGNKRREAVGEEAASYAELEAREHGVLVDWSYEAAGFYDRAIRGMVTSLQYIGIERHLSAVLAYTTCN